MTITKMRAATPTPAATTTDGNPDGDTRQIQNQFNIDMFPIKLSMVRNAGCTFFNVGLGLSGWQSDN